MTNAFDVVGKRYHEAQTTGYNRSKVVIGAPYLITREWTEAKVVIARKAGTTAKGIVEHDGTNWYATLINPPIKVGDSVYAMERVDKAQNLRRDRIRTVREITADGIMAQYGDNNPFLITHWVLADGSGDPKKDRYNPDRRKIVLDRLSTEGMDRIADSGYAISAKEFFTHFDLPRPEVQATAFIDVERKVAWRDMGRDLRYVFEADGVSSLRGATMKGRAKVKLNRSTCHCKEVTQEEVLAQWTAAHRWQNAKLHKVQCLWCMTMDADGTLAMEDI